MSSRQGTPGDEHNDETHHKSAYVILPRREITAILYSARHAILITAVIENGTRENGDGKGDVTREMRPRCVGLGKSLLQRVYSCTTSPVLLAEEKTANREQRSQGCPMFQLEGAWKTADTGTSPGTH